ncbi:MFS transporter [Candidatus Nitrosotenuis aquarius]|uniref:MFS transporter n=1 Tax=Candidatus Nitrosotenuis aquarius TaxID=1846278 RepID=UPI00210F876F|nr:MFS transporter [Candidatus Nitrosotenuis aquarius]
MDEGTQQQCPGENTPAIVLGAHKKEFILCAAIMTGLVYMYHGSISILPTYLQQFGTFDKGEIARLMIFATTSSWLGMVLTGWLSQKIGRKKSIIIFCSASMLVSIPLAGLVLQKDQWFELFVIIFAFIVSTASGPIPAFFSERFPTTIRNSAAGFSYNAGLIFGSWSPLIALSLMNSVSAEFVPVALGINIMIGAIIVIIPTILSRETKEIELN